jgi:hypothetical protein
MAFSNGLPHGSPLPDSIKLCRSDGIASALQSFSSNNANAPAR